MISCMDKKTQRAFELPRELREKFAPKLMPEQRVFPIQASHQQGEPMATADTVVPQTRGGAFLIEESAPGEIFTAEDAVRSITRLARTAAEF